MTGPDDIAPETRVVAVEEAISTTVNDQEVVLHLDTSTYHGLNEVGRKVWDRVQEPTTVADVVAALAAEYDVTEDRVAADVRAFVADLHEADLVKLDPAPAGNGPKEET